MTIRNFDPAGWHRRAPTPSGPAQPPPSRPTTPDEEDVQADQRAKVESTSALRADARRLERFLNRYSDRHAVAPGILPLVERLKIPLTALADRNIYRGGASSEAQWAALRTIAAEGTAQDRQDAGRDLLFSDRFSTANPDLARQVSYATTVPDVAADYQTAQDRRSATATDFMVRSHIDASNPPAGYVPSTCLLFPEHAVVLPNSDDLVVELVATVDAPRTIHLALSS